MAVISKYYNPETGEWETEKDAKYLKKNFTGYDLSLKKGRKTT